MIYLASPYTHPDPYIMEERYLRVSKALAYLLQRKEWAYSPIVHCHELAKMGSLPVDAAYWREYDFHMLSRSTKFTILRIDGWEKSIGIRDEQAEAIRLGLPISYL